MPTSDELRAALEVAELEEELTAAKDGDTVDRDLKDRVRAARQDYRENHRTANSAVGAATPDVVAAVAAVKEA